MLGVGLAEGGPGMEVILMVLHVLETSTPFTILSSFGLPISIHRTKVTRMSSHQGIPLAEFIYE